MQNSSGSAGFTAVNGDTNGNATTSFRPAANDESTSANAAHSHNSPTANSHDQAMGEASSKRDHGSGKISSTTDLDDRSPPAKRKRTSSSPGDTSRRASSSSGDGAVSQRSESREDVTETRYDSERSDSPYSSKKLEDQTNEKQASKHSDSPPRSWNPQDVTPETGESLRNSLNIHLAATESQPAERGDNPTPLDPDPGAAASHPAASVEASATPQDGERRKPKREFSRRTKSGCHTCRFRKKKCGEERPECKNCHKGNFVCAGYGPKPTGYRPISKSAAAKGTRQTPYVTGYHHETVQGYQQYNGPPPHQHPQSHAPLAHPGPPSHPDAHWAQRTHQPHQPHQPHPTDARPPPPHIPPPHVPSQHPHGYDPYHQRPRDSWQAPQAPQARSDPSIHLQFNSLPRVDYSGIPPLHPQSSDSRGHSQAPPPPLPPPPPPPPPHNDPWHPAYRPSAGPVTAHSSHESVGRSSQHRLSSTLAPLTSITMNERNKMILGETVQPYVHTELLNDASDCTSAVEEYNRVAQARGHYGQDQLAACLERILDPSKRFHRLTSWTGPLLKGRCGQRTLIKAPFYCEFGYNLKIGDGVIIRPNCFFSDPCEIVIGNGCTIGEGVKFAGWNTNINPQSASGSQGDHRGGAIVIGENVKIGAGAIIMAYRQIGDGAVIGAGSVVTKNVPPRTVVCGNPARVVRELPETGVAETRQRTLIQQENESMLREMESMQKRSEREMRSGTMG